MKKSNIIIFALLLVFTGVYAQSFKRAEKKMKMNEYAVAVKILEKAVQNPLQQNQAIPLLAECYRIQNNYTNAIKWYQLAVDMPGADPEWMYFEAQALRSTGEYKKAKEKFLVYSGLNPGDSRAALYASYCDSVLGPWKNKLPVFDVRTVMNINSPFSDYAPAFYMGQLVFASERNLNLDAAKYGKDGEGLVDLLRANPQHDNMFWGELKSVKLMNSKFNRSYHDGPVFFVGDTLAFFTRTTIHKSKSLNNKRVQKNEIYFSCKVDGKWGPLQAFFLNNKDYSVGFPALSADGNTIVFVSDMPGGYGGTDIWVCKREGEKWGNPVNPGPEINTVGNEMYPSIQFDGSLMFSSDGLPGYGSLDIFCASSVDGQWSNPENMGAPVNSSFDDFSITYAPDFNGGFFTSDRPGGLGSDDIYAFRKLENFETETPVIVEITKP